MKPLVTLILLFADLAAPGKEFAVYCRNHLTRAK